MRYLSVCSGIEAATTAWHPLGWTPVAFSEIEPFPAAVLAHHYPSVPNLGDMTKFKDWPDYAIDLLVGGTPCQSFSVAGLRKGLADPRGNLMLTYLAIAARYRPAWLVWENVPGVLSSNGGKDFGALLGGLGELGYGFAYRVLDAQYVRVESHPHAVPQRRRRVFVVGYLGDWRRAAAVLFERESLCGNPPPRRITGEGLTHPFAGCLTGGGRGAERTGETRGQDPVVAVRGVAHSLCSHAAKGGDPTTDNYIAHSLRAEGFDASEDGTGRGTPIVPVVAGAHLSTYAKTSDNGFSEPPNLIAFSCKDHGADAGEIAPTLRSMGHDGSHANGGGQIAVAFAENSRAEIRLCGGDGQVAAQLTTGGGKPGQGQPCIAIQAGALRENSESGPDGVGVRTDGAAYTIEARAEVQAVAFEPRYFTRDNKTGGAPTETPDITNCKKAGDSAPVVLTLAIRGRDGEPELETRDDGTANAVLTPNGGRAGIGVGAIATFQQSSQKGKGTIGYDESGVAKPCKTQVDGQMIHAGTAVRRLTPRECERLQGFPDDYTAITVRGKPACDGPRYKALGNSMAVNCMSWIGQRIQQVEAL